MGRVLAAVVGVFVVWEIVDFLVHGVLLQPAYAFTPSLWRPQADIKMGLMFLVVFVSAAAFVFLYHRLVREKGLANGIEYGVWFGLAVGISMGYGTYAVMPIPYTMALAWFLASIAHGVLGGAIVGGLVKE